MPTDEELIREFSRKSTDDQPKKKEADDGLDDFADKVWYQEANRKMRVQMLQREQRREQSREVVKQERALAKAHKFLGKSNLPGVKAYAAETGSDIMALLARMGGEDKYADKFIRMSQAIEQAQQETEKGGVVPDILQRGVRGAGRSVTTMLGAGMVAGPYGAISMAAAQEANQAITEGRDAGLKGASLAGYAVQQGIIEGAPAIVMQKLGLGGAETMAGGKGVVAIGVKAGMKRLGLSLLQELPEELITELGHSVSSSISGVSPDALSASNIGDTIADTTVQTILTVGFLGAPSLSDSYNRKRVLGIQDEIVGYADRGHTPSRKVWKSWGMSEVSGLNKFKRRKAANTLADKIKLIRAQVEAVNQLQSEQQQVAPDQPLVSEGQGVEQQVALTTQEDVVSPRENARRSEDAIVAAQQVQQPEPRQMPTQVVETQQEAVGTAPMHHDFPVEMKGTGERIGGREVVRRLERIWGADLYYGRIGGGRGVRGIYKMKSHVSRLAKGEEASAAVVIHEGIGHHLDNTTDIRKGAPKDAIKEIRALDYNLNARRPAEGFAEFVRAYLTGATERTKKEGIDLSVEAPKFLAHFENWIAKHPDVKAKMDASRKPIAAFKRAGAAGRVMGQISETGVDKSSPDPLLQRAKGYIDSIYRLFKEEGRPVKRFSEEAKAAGYDPGSDTTPFEDYNFLRQIGPHLAATSVEYGVYSILDPSKKLGPSMTEVFVEIAPGDDFKKCMGWVYARHAVESWGVLKDPGVTLEDAKEAMRQLYNPRYERAGDKMTQFGNALVDVQVEVGAIPADEGDRVKAAYRTHIPLERARDTARGSGGRKMVDLSSVLKARRGSGLQIINPAEALLNRSVKAYERAAAQLVTNKLLDVAEGTEGLGSWFHVVPAKVMQTTFSFKQIKPQLVEAMEESLGIDSDEASSILDVIDPMTAMMIWKPDMAKVHGVPIVRVMRDGKPVFAQTRPELAEALGDLGSQHHMGVADRTARAFTATLKVGATRFNPDFILSNAFRDFEAFLMQGEKGLKGAFDPALYAAAYVTSELSRAAGYRGDETVELFRRMGGELSSYVGLDRARSRASVKRALTGKQSKLDTALNIAGFTEMGPRIAEFAAILNREGWLDRVKRGETPPLPVLVRAINAAHDVTVDFRRMGRWGRRINYYIPFFNARAEGLDKFVRTWKDNPSRATWRTGMYIVPRALLYWWFRHEDDDYKERPEWQDAYYIFTDGNGNPVWRIPRSQEWGLIESGVERMLDAMYDKDPKPIERWFGQVVDTINPGAYPSGITPFFESRFNYDSFRDRPIISETLEELQPHMQFYEYTSKFSKGVARQLYDLSGGRVDLSPAKIDHLANGLSGGLFGKGNAVVDKTISGGKWGLSDIPGLKGITLRKEYTKSVDDLYARKEVLVKLHNTKELKQEDESPVNVRSLRRIQNVTALMSELRKAARDMSADDKRKNERALTGLARAALDKPPLERYQNPLADPSVVTGAVRAAVVKHIAQKTITASSGRPGNDRADDASVYLNEMGVDQAIASELAYVRLRTQGVKPGTARKRASWFARN